MRIRGHGLVGDVRRRVRHSRRLVASYARPFEPMSGRADLLEAEYRDGVWDYLVDDRETPRFGAVAAYCLRTTAAPVVLELGCGEGMLAERLTAQHYAEFVGVDVAATAVARAEARGLGNASFVTADADTFDPGDRVFDVVVFNEMLEYLPDPLRTVSRYERWLRPGGELVVSQYRATDDARTRKIWRMLRARYATRMRTVVSTAGLTWTIEALVVDPVKAA